MIMIRNNLSQMSSFKFFNIKNFGVKQVHTKIST